MRRAWWLAISVLALAGVVYLVLEARSPATRWTASSSEALEELRQGLLAEEKYYHAEAAAHYRHALELDPGLAVAKLRLARRLDRESDELVRLVQELERTDLEPLTERERLLVRYFLMEKSQADEARRILGEYLAEHPDDPYALELECEELWRERRFDEVESCYEQILALEPNWVTAQNRLGYLAMAQGQVHAAEDRFRTYRYVAPDQANPHDSLGELLVLGGRHDEARRELEEALAIRPDFCISYANLTSSAMYAGEIDLARTYLRRAGEEEACRELADRHACRLEDYSLYHARRWEELASRWSGPCHEAGYASPWLPYLAALHTGDEQQLGAIQGKVAAESSEAKEATEGLRRSLEGLRATAHGDLDAAQAAFAAADGAVDYWGLGAGMFKLLNRLMWVEAARRDGETATAERLLGEVETINPALVAAYREGDVPVAPHPGDPGP